MTHHERQFEITCVVPLRAFCTFCRRRFEGMPSPYERADNVIVRMREEFDKHDCREKTAGVVFEGVNGRPNE